MSGGGASLPPQPAKAYTYQYQPQADTGAYGGITGLNTNVNSAYNSGASTTAGSNLTTSANSLLPYMSQILQTSFDPQSALYAQQYQQNQDQANVVNAQNGVANTPYGAGLVNQSDQNFNLNWQNNLLSRMLQGAQGAGSLLGAASGGATAGTQIGQSVPAFSNQQVQQQIADYLAYLSGGTSASNAASNQWSQEANAAIQNQQLSDSAWGGLGSGLGDIFGGVLSASSKPWWMGA